MYRLIKLNACWRACSRAVYTEGDVINPVSIGCRSRAQAKVVNNFLFTLHSDSVKHDIRLGAGPSLRCDNQPRGRLWAVMLRRVARWRCISLKVFLIQFVREREKKKTELCRSHWLHCHFTLVSSRFPTWMTTVWWKLFFSFFFKSMQLYLSHL